MKKNLLFFKLGLVLTLFSSLLRCAHSPTSSSLPTFSVSPQKTQLKNGLILITKEDRSSPIMAISLFIKTGLLWEEKPGLSNLTHQLLLKGTQNRSAYEISAAIEKIGSSIDLRVAEDYMEISIISTSQHLEVVLDILQDMVKNPVFAEEEVEKEKKYAISQMKKSEDDTFTFAYNLFKKKLYEPFQHPYAYPTLGDEEVVKSITRDEIVAHWRKFYVPQRMVLVIVSDQKDEILKRKIEEKFGSLPKGKERIECRPYSFPSLNLKPQTEEVRKDISQVFIILGYPGANVSSSEYPVFKVINTILGSGMSSKLFKELREKKKLAYSVGSFYPTRLNYSHFITYIIASEYHQDLAFNGLLEEIRKIKEGEIHPDELTRAKKYLIGSFLRKHERKSKQAWYLGWFETIGVGYEFDQKYPQLIKEVTKEQIQKVAQKYFNLYTAVIVKPTEKREKEK